MSFRSLRFFPFWDANNQYQVLGFINMVEHIFDVNPLACDWLELGSFCGESSTIILGFNKVKKLYCVDSWTFCPNYNAANRLHKGRNKSADFSAPKKIFFNRLKGEIDSKRCIPVCEDSVNASKKFDENSLDVVYIDADHSYKSVKFDLETWYKKVKPGGFICGHDYNSKDNAWPGVTKAVDEFVIEKSLEKPIRFKDSSYVLRKK